MKRDTYLITYGDKTAKAHAWNSALRKVESLIREIAWAEGCFYYLVDKVSDIGINGLRTWSNGKNEIIFTIRKEGTEP